MEVTDRELRELEHLEKKGKPLWGGTIGEDGRTKDSELQNWLWMGLIKQVGNDGFVITDKGSQMVANRLYKPCPLCGK